MDFNTTTPREMRSYVQLRSYLENRDNELVRFFQLGPVGHTTVKSRQLLTEATRWARDAENDLINLFLCI